MAQENIGHTTDEAFSLVIRAIELCAKRKGCHCADALLIEVAPDMLMLPTHRWRELRGRLSGNARVKALQFPHVYVTGNGDSGDICLKIK